MSRVTIKNFDKSTREYRKAIKEMFELFPNATYELRCNSFNQREYRDFEVCIYPEQFSPIAMSFFVHDQELFDWGRPKIIGHGYSILNNFVGISLSWHRAFNFYYEDWKKEKPISCNVNLTCYKKTVGLSEWHKDYEALRNLLNSNPNKELIERYKTQIEGLNKNVIKWEKEIKELSKLPY